MHDSFDAIPQGGMVLEDMSAPLTIHIRNYLITEDGYVRGGMDKETGEIWIEGKWVEDGIVVDWATLSHEMLHWLHRMNPRITDPHDYPK